MELVPQLPLRHPRMLFLEVSVMPKTGCKKRRVRDEKTRRFDSIEKAAGSEKREKIRLNSNEKEENELKVKTLIGVHWKCSSGRRGSGRTLAADDGV